MKRFQIWIEGHLCTGMEGIPDPAQMMGDVEAHSFQEACDVFFSTTDELKKYYNSKVLRYWGCRLYDNEADARKTWG